MSKIANAFNHGKAFIPFITCGDPNLEETKKIVLEAVNAGADLIELGIPFSDPTAEGAVIMEADLRALASGTTVDKIFDLVVDLRQTVTIPMVFMTYANVLFSYDIEKFVKRCSEVGIDGVILPDVPFEEKHEFSDICDQYGVDFISMIAPTSSSRITMIAKEAKGFLYCVSSLGVTGTRTSLKSDIGGLIDIVKGVINIPCAIGFGISNPEQAKQMSQLADGVIVGSAIVRMNETYTPETPQQIGAFIKSMKDAIS